MIKLSFNSKKLKLLFSFQKVLINLIQSYFIIFFILIFNLIHYVTIIRDKYFEL